MDGWYWWMIDGWMVIDDDNDEKFYSRDPAALFAGSYSTEGVIAGTKNQLEHVLIEVKAVADGQVSILTRLHFCSETSAYVHRR